MSESEDLTISANATMLCLGLTEDHGFLFRVTLDKGDQLIAEPLQPFLADQKEDPYDQSVRVRHLPINVNAFVIVWNSKAHLCKLVARRSRDYARRVEDAKRELADAVVKKLAQDKEFISTVSRMQELENKADPKSGKS